jgi:hypothetical protein
MARKTKEEQIAEELRAEDERAVEILQNPPPPPPPESASAVWTAVCRKPCTFAGRYWERGEEYSGFARPPSHFEVLEVESLTPEILTPRDEPADPETGSETPERKKK